MKFFLSKELTLFDDDYFIKQALANSIFFKSLNQIYIYIQNSFIDKLGFLNQPLNLLNYFILGFLSICLGLPQLACDKGYFALIIAFGFAVAFLAKLLTKSITFKFTFIDCLVLAYFLANVIATFSSAYFKESVIGLAKLVVYIFAYFWFRLAFNSNHNLKNVIFNNLILLASFMSMYGIYQYKTNVKALATWEDPTSEIHQTRVFSTLGNPNLLAGFLLPIFFLSFAQCINSLLNKRYGQSLIYAITSGLILLSIILTGSRGAYLCLPICLGIGFSIAIIVWARNFKLKQIILVLALSTITFCLAVFLVLKIPYFSDRFSTIFAGRAHSSNSYRLNVWHSSVAMLKDNFIFGIGPGNKTFRLAYGLYMKSGYDALGTYCVPLEIAVESGILGFSTFFILIFMWFLKMHIYFWRFVEKQNKIPWLVLGFVTAMLSMLVHGLVDTVFFRPQIQIIFWLIMVQSNFLPLKKSVQT